MSERKESLLLRSDSSVQVSGLEELHRRNAQARGLSRSISSLLYYLELEKEERVHFCLAKSGKRKEWVGWTMGKPAAPPPNKILHMSKLPRGLESMAGMPSLKAVKKRANSVRASWEEALHLKRWEAQHVSNDAADAHLQAVFEAHHDRILAHERGLTRMNVAGFLCVLRECALLDNATAPTDGDRIFTRVASQQSQQLPELHQQQSQHLRMYPQRQQQQQQAPSQGSQQDSYIDYPGFVACLTALAKQRRDATQPSNKRHKHGRRSGSGSKTRQEQQTQQAQQQQEQQVQAQAQAQQQLDGSGLLGQEGRGLWTQHSGLSVADVSPEATREKRQEPSNSVGAKSMKQRLNEPSPESLYQALLRQYILPLANTVDMEQDLLYDALFSPASLEVLHKFDEKLRALFSWYSTLDDPRTLPWDKIVDFKVTCGPDQFVLMLINFKVVPLLMSRQDAFQCCDQCFSPEGVSSLFRDMSYSGYLLCLAACATLLPGTLAGRIQSSCTPEELHHYKRYLVHAEPDLQQQLELVLQHMETVRRAKLDDKVRRASGKDFYVFQGERYQAATEKHVAETDLEGKLAVLNRREEVRQALALTRLRNFYADVRSVAVFQNLRKSSKGPSRTTGNTPGLKARKPASAGHVWGEAGLGIEQAPPKTPASNVAFFSGSMQIKTPKLSALHGAPSSQLAHPYHQWQPPWAQAATPRQSLTQQVQAPWAHAQSSRQQVLHQQLLNHSRHWATDAAETTVLRRSQQWSSEASNDDLGSQRQLDRSMKQQHSWKASSPRPPPALKSLKSMAASLKSSHDPTGNSTQSIDSPFCWVPNKKAVLVEQELQLLTDATHGLINGVLANGSRLGHMQPQSHHGLPGQQEHSPTGAHHHQSHTLTQPPHSHTHQPHSLTQQPSHQQQQLQAHQPHSSVQPTSQHHPHLQTQQHPHLSSHSHQHLLLLLPHASSAPHADRLCIEARDESEVMRAFTATLPSISNRHGSMRRPCSQPHTGAPTQQFPLEQRPYLLTQQHSSNTQQQRGSSSAQ